MQSSAKTVQEYLKELPADRREAIKVVRGVILANLPKGYEECMSYGMIGYVVPHSPGRTPWERVTSANEGFVRADAYPLA